MSQALTPRRGWLRRQSLAFWVIWAAGAGLIAGTVVLGVDWLVGVELLLLAVLHIAYRNAGGEGGALGPVFFYETARLARRGRTTLLRCAYAVVLLGALAGAYAEVFRFDPLDWGSWSGTRAEVSDLPRFAQRFALALLVTQGAAVLVLTPAYVAGAVAEEKERRTLELLLTSHLSDGEIVKGKLFARLMNLGGVLLAGLPVLCLTLLWGGVSAHFLLGGFVTAAATLLSVGGISVLCSVMCRKALTAVVASYALVAIFNWVCLGCTGGCATGALNALSSPVAFVLTLGPYAETATVDFTASGYVVLHGAIAALCTALAVRRLRRYALADELPRPPAVAEVDRAPAEGSALPSVRRTPPVGNRPLLWKEVYLGGPAPPSSRQALKEGGWIWFVTLLFCGLGTLIVCGNTPDRGRSIALGLNLLYRAMAILLAGSWCVSAAFRAAGCLSRERERGTLDGLLSLPVERGAVLRAKWLGSALRGRGLGYAMAALWSMALITGALHPLAVPLSALTCATYLALVTSVGLWLSLVSGSTLRANVCMAVALLLIVVGPWVVALDAGRGWVAHFSVYGFNPVGAWWFAGLSWSDLSGAPGSTGVFFRERLIAVLVGQAINIAVAGVLWLLAWRRLRATAGR